MITAQRIDRLTPADRSDTQLIPIPGLRPLPTRLDPRARTVLEVLRAAASALARFTTVMVAVAVIMCFVVVGALTLPSSVAVAGIVAIVALYIHGRAGRAR